MIAFLGKTDRRDVLPYVHAGWTAALGAGGLTWAAATYLISISGASRELTEGFGSLICALAVILAGKGVAALQEAGLVDIRPFAIVPRIEVLGVFPTVQGVAAQALTVTTIVVGFGMSGRRRPIAA